MLLQTEPADALEGGAVRIWPGWSA
jgi:hypothetical protein